MRAALFLLVMVSGCSSKQDPRAGAELDLLGILATLDEVVVPEGNSVELTAIGLFSGKCAGDHCGERQPIAHGGPVEVNF